MSTSVHHKVSAIADGADTTVTRPSDWNASHDTTITDGSFEVIERMVLASSERLTVSGVGRVQLLETLPPFRGAFNIGSVEILNDNYQLQYKRATLAPGARATLVGTGELFIFDLAPVGRLVLAGRGG